MSEVSTGWSSRAAEALLLALACFAPWAFGSVEAWALLVVDAGVALIACLQLADHRLRGSSLSWNPALPLLLMACLAVFQTLPMPGPPRYDGLAPAEQAQVLEDEGRAIAPPPSTISKSPEASAGAAARLASGALLLTAAAGAVGGWAGFRRFALVTSVNGAAMGLFAIVQAMSWDGKIFGVRASPIVEGWRTGGPFVGHNALAAYLNLCLGLSLGLLAGGVAGRSARGPSARRGTFNPWAAYLPATILVGLLWSHSRSGILGAVAAGLILGAALGRRRLRAGLLATASVGLVALVVLTAAGGTSPFVRMTSILDKGSYGDRMEIWRASLAAWSRTPWLGSGLGTFAIAAGPEFQRDHGVVFARAENEYLDVLVEGGLIGLVAISAAVAGAAVSATRAVRAAKEPRDHALALGGCFGLVALTVQSGADFSPHIPGVAVPALILCGHLVGLASPLVTARRPALVSWARAGGAAASLAILVHSAGQARLEYRLARVGLPTPGAVAVTDVSTTVPRARLETMKSTLEAALAEHPRWAEGWLRLGFVHQGLYRSSVLDALGEEFDDEGDRATLADPLWVHGLVHSSSGGPRAAALEVLSHEPIRAHLSPAARCFLMARSLSPWSPAAHAGLATVDYLVAGESPRDHIRRALSTAGADFRTRMKVARAAAQAGLLDSAAAAWRSCLEVRDSSWELVAAEAAQVFEASEMLAQVAPDGARWPARFAEFIYDAPEDRPDRELCLAATLDRLPDDHSLGEADRSRLTAVACAGLGRGREAGEAWRRALALAPAEAGWRAEYIDWLTLQGEPAEAHEHALAGLQFHPDDARLRAAAAATAEALARGRSETLPAR